MDIISRKEAKEQNLKTYFTGNPCKNGHVCSKTTSSGSCIECLKIAAVKRRRANIESYRERDRQNNAKRKDKRKAWRVNNIERIAIQDAEYRRINKEKIKEKDKIYTMKNKSKILSAIKAWRCNNRDKVALDALKRVRKKRQAIPKWYNLHRLEVKDLYNTAKELTEMTGILFHVDHIIPLSNDLVCGLHCYDNLQILPYYENCAKGNTFLIETNIESNK